MGKGISAAAAAMALASLTWGATYNIGTTTVDNWNDDGVCSLAEAVYAINNRVSVNTNDCPAGSATSNTVNLQGGTFAAPVTYATTHPLVFTGPVNLVGKGIDRTVLAANFSDPAHSRLVSFEDHTYTQSTLRGMTLQRNASANTTTGVHCDWGTAVRIVQAKIRNFGLGGVTGIGADVVIDSSALQDNISIGYGGGVSIWWYSNDHVGSLVMHDCSVTGNAGGGGGGIYYAGDGNSNLYNVTIADNEAYSGQGGGLLMETHAVGYLNIYGCTITGNRAAVSGGGVAENAGSTPPHLFQCLVAGNTAPTGKDVDGWFNSSNTLYGDYTGNAAPRDPSVIAPVANPGLGSLAETGWPLNIKMIPLSATSPAVDATDPNVGQLTGVDGRGRERIADGNQNGFKTGDHGAYEYDPLFKETDTLGMTKSNDTHNVFTDPECAGNKCTNLAGSGTSSYVTYHARVYRTGTYNLRVRLKKNNNRGIFQLAYGAQGGALTNVGGAQDMYAANPAFVELNFGNIVFGTTGVKSFRFQVTGKNAASSGHQLYFDYIKLTGP